MREPDQQNELVAVAIPVLIEAVCVTIFIACSILLVGIFATVPV